MKIAFLYAGGRENRWAAAREGRAPSDFFYGAVELARAGHEVTCVDAPSMPGSWLAAIYNRLFAARTPARTRGEHVVAVGRALRRLRSADVIVAASTSHANALALWKKLALVPGQIVGIHCGHVNFPPSATRRRADAWAMREQEIVLFAESERSATIADCGVEADRVHANAFGVDVDFWTPAEVPREFILSVGNDGRRDYGALVEAARNLPVPVKIVTNRPLPDLQGSQVEHLRGSWHAPAVSDVELRDLYRRAIAVVVPLEDSIQPSGQSVALQAMACGRPVVLTRTRGLWTGADFLDGRDLILVGPGSASALRNAMQLLLDDAARREQIGRNAHEIVIQNGTINAFADRLRAVIETAHSRN